LPTGRLARLGATPDFHHGLLKVGDRFPDLKGQFLTGRSAVLPAAAAGKVTLVAMGFTYASRFPVEAWAEWYRTKMGPRTDVAFFEVPMIGGLATLGRWFIDRGMRNGAPAALHESVITVYGGTTDWKTRLAYSAGHKDDAYLVLCDRDGLVRWIHHGVFDDSHADALHGVLASLTPAIGK
jgi:hypothetical protein